MKHLFFVLLLAGLGGAISAQNLSSASSLDQITRSLFERLDKSGLQSGILLQQSALFVNPRRYDGHALNDSNSMDASRFGKLYGQLRAASTNLPVLPDPAVYLNILRRRAPSDTVLLAALALQFDYIRADAFDAGLLQWDADHKIQLRPGHTASPFALDTCLAFAALTPQAAGKRVTFCLPANFFFQNLGWPVEDMELDFGDGKGWRAVRPGANITVQYQGEVQAQPTYSHANVSLDKKSA